MSNVNLKRKSKLNESNSYLNIPKVNAVDSRQGYSKACIADFITAERDIAQHNVFDPCV